MAAPGVGISAPSQAALSNLLEQKLRAERVVRVGAGWFVTIAVLSLVNSVLSMAGTGIHFVVGLGVTELVDAVAHQAGQTGFALALIINGSAAAAFVLFWRFARQGAQWAFLVGMALYALDAALVFFFKDYLALAFHAYALYRIYIGMSGIPVLGKLEAALAPAGAPIQPM
jgi:hypothetical protein